MERLMEISHTLASTLDLAHLLREIVVASCELTDCDASSILLLDPQSGELRFEATSNHLFGEVKSLALPLEASIAGWVVTNAQPLLVPDTATDPRWNPLVDELTAFATRSVLGVPLIAREQTIGVLEAINKRGRFTPDDTRLLQWLAAQAAIAIVNARLFMQSDLIAEMVHELRTPLQALLAGSQLLARPEVTDDQRQEVVAALQRETARLSQLTTDFLDMARLESGRARFTFTRFHLPALIDEALDLIQPQASQRRLRLIAQPAPALPPIESDRDKLKQVLLNLLTNAVKYNRPGGEVIVRAESASGYFRLYVDDTGPGIQPEALPRLFEKFYRAPASENAAEGTGLGLPIARRIVEALGGELNVQSTPGQGSTFYFILPPTPRKTQPLAEPAPGAAP
jgi:signal transduction histidine kinase